MKNFLVTGLVLLLAMLPFLVTTSDYALAQSAQQSACEGAGGTWDPGSGTCDDGADGISNLFQSVINMLLFLLGAVAVVMLVIGGFRYVTSAGDSGAIESAKNTILYAIIGIIVAFLAWAAVDFVITQLQ